MNDILSKANTYQQTYHDVGRAHYIAANYYARLNQVFGVPVIIITAVVGTTIFATLNDSPDPKWKILAGLVSLAGAVLAALQTSLGFSETAQKHKEAGESYRAMQRCFETFQLKYAEAQEDQPHHQQPEPGREIVEHPERMSGHVLPHAADDDVG